MIFQRKDIFSKSISQNDDQSFHTIKFAVLSVTEARLSARIRSFREVPFCEIG